MKRLLTMFLAAVVILFPVNIFNRTAISYAVPQKSAKHLNIEGEGIVLMEEKTGRILYEYNARKRLYPASTTKILTALIAIESGDLDEAVTVGNEVYMIPEDASRAGIKAGEQYTLKNMIMALMLPSGNDAANAVAVHIGRRTCKDKPLDDKQAFNRFIELMNKRAAEIGAVNSKFVNPHGYHDNGHYSTAYDIAIIAREAMKNEFFRKSVKTAAFSTKNKSELLNWSNTNLLINKQDAKHYYPYATGIKTGTTYEAGPCLVSSASKNSMDLISVVLKSTEEGRWAGSKALFEYGFNYYMPLLSAGTEEQTDVAQKAPVTKGQIAGKSGYNLYEDNIAETNAAAETGIRKDSTAGQAESGERPYRAIELVVFAAFVAALAMALAKLIKSAIKE